MCFAEECVYMKQIFPNIWYMITFQQLLGFEARDFWTWAHYNKHEYVML